MIRLLVLLALSSCSAERDREPACADCSGVHPDGILDEASPEFHGAELSRRNWDFALCATCHGADLRGGTSGVSCTSCHADGATACTTCHADGPTSAAHGAHRSAGLACGECHAVPATWDAPGHILDDTAPAEVSFGARAALTPVPGDREGPPVYLAGTCRNVYCHGDALHAPGGTATEPRWETPTGAGCGSCHGTPPPSHAQVACATCHPADAPHIDGVTQIGAIAGCSGCHGDATSAAPPRDLAGETFTTALGVGAHRAHLEAPSGLAAPIACGTCHVVPVAITDAGHLDSPGPAEVDAALGWDRVSATCTTAWCHRDARPRWTEQGGAACGSCHAIPPATPVHATATTLATCATCHPADLVDHVNGVVDVR